MYRFRNNHHHEWTCAYTKKLLHSHHVYEYSKQHKLLSVLAPWYTRILRYHFQFWCRIHLWFRWMGGLQAKSMTSQRNRAIKDGGYVLLWQRYDNNKMADMCYYGNVMITTRWWLCVTRDWACYRCILHLQQYSHRLNLFFSFIY